jgi:cell division protein FtsA
MLGTHLSPNIANILFSTFTPSKGVQKGNVSDISITSKNILSALDKVKETTGINLKEFTVGISGTHIKSETRHSQINSDSSRRSLITHDRLMEPILPSNSPRKIIHSFQTGFSLDNGPTIRNPVGMHSDQVTVDSQIVEANLENIEKIKSAIELSGIKISNIVVNPLASGAAVLTNAEMNDDRLVIDIGGGTTDVLAINDGAISFVGVLPVGGNQFTTDIANNFNSSFEEAERIKIKHASANITINSQKNNIPITDTNGNVNKIPIFEICQLARERSRELAKLIAINLTDNSIDQTSYSKILITGGGSLLPGITQVFESVLLAKTINATPTDIETNEHAYTNLSAFHSSAAGLMKWSLNQHLFGSILKLSTTNSVQKSTAQNYVQTKITSLLSKIPGKI